MLGFHQFWCDSTNLLKFIKIKFWVFEMLFNITMGKNYQKTWKTVLQHFNVIMYFFIVPVTSKNTLYTVLVLCPLLKFYLNLCETLHYFEKLIYFSIFFPLEIWPMKGPIWFSNKSVILKEIRNPFVKRWPECLACS